MKSQCWDLQLEVMKMALLVDYNVLLWFYSTMRVEHRAGIYATLTGIKLWVLNCLYYPLFGSGFQEPDIHHQRTPQSCLGKVKIRIRVRRNILVHL